MDAQPCMRYRGHEQDESGSEEWFHWSGEPDNEYLWNDTRWGWRGPVVGLADSYYPENGGWMFTEGSL